MSYIWERGIKKQSTTGSRSQLFDPRSWNPNLGSLIGVADPGFGPFFTPGFGSGISFFRIQKNMRQRIFVIPSSFLFLDPGWRKFGIRDKHPGSATWILLKLDPDHYFEDPKVNK